MDIMRPLVFGEGGKCVNSISSIISLRRYDFRPLTRAVFSLSDSLPFATHSITFLRANRHSLLTRIAGISPFRANL